MAITLIFDFKNLGMNTMQDVSKNEEVTVPVAQIPRGYGEKDEGSDEMMEIEQGVYDDNVNCSVSPEGGEFKLGQKLLQKQIWFKYFE